MSSDFWAKAIGGIARPPAPQPQPPAQGPWWQQNQGQYAPEPQYQPPAPGYPQGYPPNPALAAQMPGQYPGQAPQNLQGMQRDQYIAQLKRIPADQLNQQQMEEIAQFELEHDRKYNQECPSCGSSDFVPAGTVIGNKRMGADKCFACGASASTYVSSPEPARGGGGKASRAPYRDVRQIDTGGGAGSMYLKFNGIPTSYVPRA